jgi:hypothetical protein
LIDRSKIGELLERLQKDARPDSLAAAALIVQLLERIAVLEDQHG